MSAKAEWHFQYFLKKHNPVVLRCPKDDEMNVRAVGGLLSRALREVIANARTYSSGPVTVTAYRVDQMAVVDVTDEGQGLAPGVEQLAFLPFYREVPLAG